MPNLDARLEDDCAFRIPDTNDLNIIQFDIF